MATHDYTKSMWGHALSTWHSIGDEGKYTVLGHGPHGVKAMFGERTPQIAKGDVIQVKMESGKIGSATVEEIEYFRDPPDMFKATLQFTEYAEVSGE